MTTWKKAACVGLGLGWLAMAPSGRAESGAPAAAPAPADPLAKKYLLRQILITDSLEAAQALTPAPNRGFVVIAPALSTLDAVELNKRLALGENQAIETRILASIAQVIENFARQQGFPDAHAIIPPQNIQEGAVRVAVQLKPSKLRQILVADSVEAVQKLSPVPGGPFVVLSPSLSSLDAAGLTKKLAAGENRIIDDRLLAEVAQVIENHARQHDLPTATVVTPPQNNDEGAVRVALQPGKIRNIRVQGNRWFSEALLREKLRVEKGETLRLSELDSAISWVNNNPFRRVRVHLEPVPGTGEADMIIGVQEALPLRLALAYDNGGNEILGTNRYMAGLSYANLWGLDHQVSYQFMTTDRPRFFQGHGFDYRVPLPWRHYVQLSASYVRARPEFFEGLFVQDGKSITTDLRYTIPLRTGDSPAEIYATLSFKESNNNLTYGGTEVGLPKNDIFQVTAGGSTVRRDKRGAWAFGASITASPGGVNSHNTDAIFQEAHFGAKAAYVYGTLSYQRLLTLTRGWEFTSRGVAHLSGQNLISSEQLTIGGSGSVRGFNENVFAGDQGFVFTNDLLAPAWKKQLSGALKQRGPLETRFLLFYDAANVAVRHRYSTDISHGPLASTGVGVRMTLATNFSLSADYGWQITHLPYKTDANSRGHLKVSLAF